MGNCSGFSKSNDSQLPLSRSDFTNIYSIGKGSLGRVWKVVHNRSGRHLAIKEMNKRRIESRNCAEAVLLELHILEALNSPFIINVRAGFQSRNYLYLAMELVEGGDLRYHLTHLKTFTEEQTRFYIASLLLALEHIHSKEVIHGDIKPENLVLDYRGYLYITDFGVASFEKQEPSFIGTPCYMAPEVLCKLNHTPIADYYALGILIYEFMTGRRPFKGKSRREMKLAVFGPPLIFNSLPTGWSPEVFDLISKLLENFPQNRLGFNGQEEIRKHPWFDKFNWNCLYQRKMVAPFVPNSYTNFDQKHVNSRWESLSNRKSKTNEFYSEYYYDNLK